MNLPQFQRNPQCNLCSLHEVARFNRCLPTIRLQSSLPPGPSIPFCLFIGQNPGWEEDRDGIPFIGPSGEYLRSVYIDGISLTSLCSVYLTNAARCGPSQDVKPTHTRHCFPSYTVPDLTEILSCHSSFFASASSSASLVASSVPTSTSSAPTPNTKGAVVLLGAPAVAAFYTHYTGKPLSLSDAIRSNGNPITIEPFAPLPVFATYNPFALIMDGNMIHAISAHMQLVLDYFTDVMVVPSSPTIVPPFHPRTK